jgi:hypothetical protein
MIALVVASALTVSLALAQDGASCPAADPTNGLGQIGQTVQTLAAPQSFEIGLATRVRTQDLRGQAELQATCYDDGDACPGGCDAHVVANTATNGSARMHAPDSAPGAWQDCRNGQDCEVCFGSDPADCMTVTFRGTGPDAGRADFTAAFWAELCAVRDLPQALSGECDRIRTASAALGAVSCLAQPDAPGCTGRVATATQRDAARQAVADCLARQAGSWRCYYQGPGGTLSPGACPNGAVNSSGWDCCNGDRDHDACVTGCGAYYTAAQDETVQPAATAQPTPPAEPVGPSVAETPAPVEPTARPTQRRFPGRRLRR